MAARPVEGPHESSRLACEAVTGVSNTVSCADSVALAGAAQNTTTRKHKHPQSRGEN